MANSAPQVSNETPDPALSRQFARKVRLSTVALFFERLWPRLWLLLALAILLAALSLSGVFLGLSSTAHGVIMALFAAAALAALVYASRVPWPAREEAIRRIERRSGVPHRPATSYEDTLTTYSENPETQTLWKAHRDRLAKAMSRLKVGNPSPRADRFDPLALRILPVLLLIPALGLVSGSIYDRLASAFRFGTAATRADTRVDAWVTPPAYTGNPPVMLADGNDPKAETRTSEEPKLFEVPAKSLLTLRGTGFGGAKIALEITEAGAEKPVIAAADAPKAGKDGKPASDKLDIAEVRFELKTASRVRALAGSQELGRWTFDVVPDQLPKITFNEEMSRTAKGSLKISYKGEDDYGIATGVARVRQLPPEEGDPKKAWARGEAVKGPRLPLERPPEIALKIPQTGAKTFEAASLHELGAHPWAGQKVEMWLEVTDVAGQIGRSETREVTLPMRAFRKPLARAVIEQRRKLAEDSRNRPYVVRALDALTIEPEGFIEKSSIYLGLRSVYHRIERENSREAIVSSIDQLWNIALKIEDGMLSDAEKELKDAQDRLSKALQDGASEEEIKQLMQELKQAMNRYMEEMQKNAEKDGQQPEEDGGEKKQVTQEDMEQMLRDLEENAKNGSREEAERLLSEMKEMMENMQPGQSQEQKEAQQRANEMMKRLDDLSDMSGKQQKLMDDTFDQQKQQEGGPQQKGKQQSGGKQKGPQQQGEGSEQGGQSQQRQKNAPAGNQQAEPGQGKSGEGKGGLKDRQSDLRKKLEKLQSELNELGAGGSDRLKDAQEAMKGAEDALEQGDLEEAGAAQGDALEKMRQSAQKMAEQLQKEANERRGRNANNGRDPLDRPQRSEGPDLGNSVKVPNAIDAQRAREILDELRKRSGQALRPPSELDYIDRLLKRF